MDDRYLCLFSIPFEVNKNIAVDGWYPSESDVNDEFLTRLDFDIAMEEYKKANEKVIFSNTYLCWDSCDCGDGYGCSHGSWVYSVGILTDNKENIEFDIYDEDLLNVNNGKRGSDYKELNLPIGLITVGDFWRATQLMGVELKFTDYGNSLLKLNPHQK